MDINLNLEDEKRKTMEDLDTLGKQLNQVKNQERQITQAIYMRQGVLRYLNSMNGGGQNEPNGD